MQQADLDVHEPARDEADAIADFLNDHARTLFREAAVDAAEVASWFGFPSIWIRVATRHGRVVGYADVVKDEQSPRYAIDARTLDGDVADVLLAAAEEHARSRAVPGDLLRGYAASIDEVLSRAYERGGYRVIRHSFEMRIDLPEAIEEPAWPEGITLRTYEPRDELRVYEAGNEAFEDHWDFHRSTLEEWRRYGPEREAFDASLWWIAEDADEVAAVCQNWWHFSGDKTFGWIGTLGVRRPWRKRGLGRGLLLHSFADFKRRGATRVGLGVDAENTTGAVRLYESVGMVVARRNDTWEKPL